MPHPRDHATRQPAQAAIIMAESGTILTYGELETKANQGAHLLRELGLKAGDTLAIWLKNCPDYFTIYWAAQRTGLYIAPISTAFTAEEAAYILSDSGARVLVTSNTVRHAEELLQTSQPASVEHAFTIGRAFSGLPDWKDAIAGHPATPVTDETAGFHMVYSSGTTGKPKGIRQPLSGGPATAPHPLAERARDNYGICPQSVYLSPAPLYHTAPLAFSTSCHRLGATVVIMEKFTPEGALEAIENHHVNITQMVPTMFVRMLRMPDAERLTFDVSSLQTVIHAAAPCPVDIKHQMIDWLGPILLEYYGGSEGNGSTSITSEEWLRKPGSVGKANWGVIHVCGEDDEELPAGEPGLIYFEGGWDFKYLNDDQKTRDARHPIHAGWSTLGDVGYLDEDGYLFLTDRKSFMIISGGVNIYPQEIEDTLICHPDVLDAAVIGVPNAEMGEEVKAVVQPVRSENADDAFGDQLVAWCRSRLSPVKCPKSVDFVNALPRGDNGKLYKRQIRDRYWPAEQKGVN
ncbi:acyl-CoA synthetase [Henriciella aquimarina]|uniref:acyl-CoA synthetase n=1 Tax=Henriciella aquimarina TaxID=545261 RepID=UPI0009FCE57E|nr:acyl-CoA synthetase [Henriciella aquimarina]